jgi:hypothetical protein
MNPYINPMMQAQDLGGLNAVYQNTAAQQQFQNQAAMQGQQLAQQAGQTAQQSNPMALAQALRKSDPNNPDAPNMLQNAQAYINSKFGRDSLSPDSADTASTAQQYYGSTYNPNAGWSGS